jgi:transcriptional regulator of heat shock response
MAFNSFHFDGLSSKMEAIIGTLLGALITGFAMVLNSFFNARIAREKDEQSFKRKNFEKYLSDLEQLYEDALHLSDKLIRGKGRASTGDLESFYRIEIQLSLKSTTEIYAAFKLLKGEVATMAQKLPDLPEEFVPKFEDDEHRRSRLERRKEAEDRRDEQARQFLGDLYRLHKTVADKMKTHLAQKKKRLLLNMDSRRANQVPYPKPNVIVAVDRGFGEGHPMILGVWTPLEEPLRTM